MEKDQDIQPDSMMEDDQDSRRVETVAPAGGSADKPLRVKIKFPNMKESAEEEDGPKVKDHCCLECKKRFNSGKALGGHMSSAHVQANRDFSLKKLKSKRRAKQVSGLSSPSDYGGKIICKICGKNFRTNKSLFGHMRCHPDREWRGMEPPVEAAMNFLEPEFEVVNGVPSRACEGDQIDSGPVVASPPVNLNKSVKWQVTGKRGRAPTKPLIDSPPLRSSEEILAVQQLIRLVNGDSVKPIEDQDSKLNESEATSSNCWTSENETDDVNQDFYLNKNKEKVFPVGDERDSPVKKLKTWERADENPGGAQVKRILYNGKGEGKLNPGSDTENLISSDYSLDEFDDPYKSGTNGSMMIIKKTKVKKSVDPESQTSFSPTGPVSESVPLAVTPDKYICNTCRKSFSTPQALGGHRSSHKKFKVKVYNTIDDQSSNEVSYANYRPKANAIKQLEVNNVIGVQNQCHSTGECNHADRVTSTEETKKKHKVLLKFNLNEIPSQDGEDVIESGDTAS
ncbi:uncharacterized protein LOC111412859 [Olea europaea var. sylvestris]|uniref:uncharacterized protein LOC111412859 n=1 Tax=Olea europaea var. sylvestris TaxID=158386 RepID=UPI000C1D518A|nr:uncharacterized protein LOC111412859 [Olea europaea var. sylvestris]